MAGIQEDLMHRERDRLGGTNPQHQESCAVSTTSLNTPYALIAYLGKLPYKCDPTFL